MRNGDLFHGRGCSSKMFCHLVDAIETTFLHEGVAGSYYYACSKQNGYLFFHEGEEVSYLVM